MNTRNVLAVFRLGPYLLSLAGSGCAHDPLLYGFHSRSRTRQTVELLVHETVKQPIQLFVA